MNPYLTLGDKKFFKDDQIEMLKKLIRLSSMRVEIKLYEKIVKTNVRGVKHHIAKKYDENI